jgi:hypothetical protein
MCHRSYSVNMIAWLNGPYCRPYLEVKLASVASFETKLRDMADSTDHLAVPYQAVSAAKILREWVEVFMGR